MVTVRAATNQNCGVRSVTRRDAMYALPVIEWEKIDNGKVDRVNPAESSIPFVMLELRERNPPEASRWELSKEQGITSRNTWSTSGPESVP